MRGNCRRLNAMGRSDGINGILGMNTDSPLPHPVKMVATIKLLLNSVTCNLVPLHSYGGLRLRSNMTVAPTFTFSLCRGRPGGLRVLRNSTG